MLFAYKYVPHNMEKMQEFIDFIFYEVWCKAPSTQYGLHLYKPNEDLHRIMEWLNLLDLSGNLKKGAAKDFYEDVNSIYCGFKELSDDEIEAYKAQFAANNSIEELCGKSGSLMPATYQSLNPKNAHLNAQMRSFYADLYSSGFFELKRVREIVGASISDYYKSFVRENDNGVCPFCGLMPIDGEYDPTRDAFDHYLPKGKYPFNSVNLKNLAPSCSKCNSGNKHEKDPLHNDAGIRRKAFYPFSRAVHSISIDISILRGDWSRLTPERILISIVSESASEEVETWEDLFRVKQRYEARCCNKNGGISWLGRILDECHNYGLSPKEMFAAEIQSAERNLWNEASFLKRAFLIGCDKTELFA